MSKQSCPSSPPLAEHQPSTPSTRAANATDKEVETGPKVQRMRTAEVGSASARTNAAEETPRIFDAVGTAIPNDVSLLIFSMLGPKDLLCLREICRDSLHLASSDVLWSEILNSKWGGEDVASTVSSLASDRDCGNGGACMDAYRRTVVPPPALNDSERGLRGWIENMRPPQPPTDPDLRKALKSQESTARALEEYRLLVEISHDDGTKVLSQVVRAFPGMLRSSPFADFDFPPGSDWSEWPGIIAVEESMSKSFPTPPVPPRSEWAGPSGPLHEWQMKAFGDEMNGTQRPNEPPGKRFLTARISIEHQGSIVSLSGAGGYPEFFNGYAQPEELAAKMRFSFHLPVTSLPVAMLEELWEVDGGHFNRGVDGGDFFQYIQVNFCVRMEPTSPDAKAWVPTHFYLEAMEPRCSDLSQADRLLQNNIFAGEWYYEEDDAWARDDMLLVCLAEAVAAQRRKISDYLHPGELANDLDRDLLRAVVNSDWNRMRNLRRAGAKFIATVRPGDKICRPFTIGNQDRDSQEARHPGVGKTPLHFAVFNHAPLSVIKEIYEAFPFASYLPDRDGYIPRMHLERETDVEYPTPSYTSKEEEAVYAYLDSLPPGV